MGYNAQEMQSRVSESFWGLTIPTEQEISLLLQLEVSPAFTEHVFMD